MFSAYQCLDDVIW